jgi:hypothetical protein
MQMEADGEFLVPIHRDRCGDSSSLQVFDTQGAERDPLDQVVFGGGSITDVEFEGMCKMLVKEGDLMIAKTACCTIIATVSSVEANAVQLTDVEFAGPWANFNGGDSPDSSALTFGSVVYTTTGEEEVTATGFSGTLSQYRRIREEEAGKNLLPAEIEQRRKGYCFFLDPTLEHAHQLAEAAGY